MENTIDWNDPVARLKLIEQIGPEAYNTAVNAHLQESTIEHRNGHALRRVHSQFGPLISVEGSRQAFRDIESARRLADSLPPGKYTTPAHDGDQA